MSKAGILLLVFPLLLQLAAVAAYHRRLRLDAERVSRWLTVACLLSPLWLAL